MKRKYHTKTFLIQISDRTESPGLNDHDVRFRFIDFDFGCMKSKIREDEYH